MENRPNEHEEGGPGRVSGLEPYIQAITASMKAVGKWNDALTLQVFSCASAWRALAMVNRDIDGLDSCYTESPQGEKPHPAFALLEKREASVTKQMKALGLTAEDMPAETVPELVALTRQLAGVEDKTICRKAKKSDSGKPSRK